MEALDGEDWRVGLSDGGGDGEGEGDGREELGGAVERKSATMAAGTLPGLKAGKDELAAVEVDPES